MRLGPYAWVEEELVIRTSDGDVTLLMRVGPEASGQLRAVTGAVPFPIDQAAQAQWATSDYSRRVAQLRAEAAQRQLEAERRAAALREVEQQRAAAFAGRPDARFRISLTPDGVRPNTLLRITTQTRNACHVYATAPGVPPGDYTIGLQLVGLRAQRGLLGEPSGDEATASVVDENGTLQWQSQPDDCAKSGAVFGGMALSVGIVDAGGGDGSRWAESTSIKGCKRPATQRLVEFTTFLLSNLPGAIWPDTGLLWLRGNRTCHYEYDFDNMDVRAAGPGQFPDGNGIMLIDVEP